MELNAEERNRLAFNHVFQRLMEIYGRRDDQLAWHIVYWLEDQERISARPTDAEILEAYTAYLSRAS